MEVLLWRAAGARNNNRYGGVLKGRYSFKMEESGAWLYADGNHYQSKRIWRPRERIVIGKGYIFKGGEWRFDRLDVLVLLKGWPACPSLHTLIQTCWCLQPCGRPSWERGITKSNGQRMRGWGLKSVRHRTRTGAQFRLTNLKFENCVG